MDSNSVPRFRLADDLKPQPERPVGPQPGTPVNRSDLAEAWFDRAARRRLGAWFTVQLDHNTLLHRANWPLAAAAAIVTTVTTLGLWFAGAFVTALFGAVSFSGRHAGTWLAGDHVIRTATGAITAWLNAHAAGLPATSTQLGMAWLGIAGLLYLAAIARSTFARIGWAATGAAAIAAAYYGATTGPAAAAATVAALWLLLSLPAYRRRRRHNVPADIAS